MDKQKCKACGHIWREKKETGKDLVCPKCFTNQSHDVCVYCGFDNGANGELRQGWDCGRCGSN